MALTLEQQKNRPNMGVMITISLVVHIFIFMQISELHRLKPEFEKPEPPIKIEVTLKEIPKPLPVAEATPAVVTPPITEDSRIIQPAPPIPEPVKIPEPVVKKVAPVEEPPKKRVKPVKKKVIVEQKKKPPKPEVVREVVEEPAVTAKPAVVEQQVAAPMQIIPINATPSAEAAPQRRVLPSAQPSQSDEISAKAYFNAMRLMIEKNKRYPQMARRRNQEGSVRVRFLIDKSGNVNSLEIVKKSDYASLDQAALEAVRRAAPFSKPPASISREALKLELTINFKLI